MDLRAYLRVIGRYRWLVAVGLLLGIALAFLSFVRISPGSEEPLAFREDEEWIAESTIFVTQAGFPWGRSRLPVEAGPEPGDRPTIPRFADATRFIEAAVLYSRFADSDPVRALMLIDGPVDEDAEIEAEAQLASQQTQAALPLMNVRATGATPDEAITLTNRVTRALRQYVVGLQVAESVPPDQRMLLEVIKRPDDADLRQGRSLTRPVVILLAAIVLVVGLCFILENLRRGRRIAWAWKRTLPDQDAEPDGPPRRAGADGRQDDLDPDRPAGRERGERLRK